MKAIAGCALSCLLSLLVAGQGFAGEFKPIFDGKTLEGWKAPNMSYWSVTDNAITAQSTEANPCKTNQFLVWQGGGGACANLLQGNSINTYSTDGYGYAVEKAGSSKGWSFTIYEEEWNYGFHQEMAHFADCVLNDKTPIVTGQDGRAVLEVIFAAYASAGKAAKINLPFKTEAKKPIDLWKPVN